MKTPIITIKDFQKGIADSPTQGFAKIVGLDVDYIKGVAQVNWKMERESGTSITTATPKWLLKKDANTSYVVSASKIYKFASGSYTDITTGSGATTIYGAKIWKGYLLVFLSDSISLYNGSSWTTSWASATLNATTVSTYGHPSYVSADGDLYIASGRYVSKLEEVAGQTFDPTSAGTYSFSSNITDFGSATNIYSFSDLGAKLMAITNTGIYPVDRSTYEFDVPVSEVNSTAGKVINGILYFFGQGQFISSAIYATNGSTTKKVRELPRYIFDSVSRDGFNATIIQEYQIGTDGDKLLFMTSKGLCSYNTATGALVIENLTSNGDVTLNGAGGLLVSTSNVYRIGWGYSTSFGVDITQISFNTVFTDPNYDRAYIETGLYDVGNAYEKTTFSGVELKFYSPFTTQTYKSGVRVKYRLGITGNWSTLGTVTATDYTGSVRIPIDLSIVDAQNIQFRIEFGYIMAANLLDFIRLKEVAIY